MRAYSISITDPKTGKLFVPPSLAALGVGASYTSLSSGIITPGTQSLAGALNIEMDIQVATFAQPAGGSFIEISGVPITDIGQGTNLNGFDISVSAGMVAGLPLATADYNQGQYGIIVQGSIYQAFANWIGEEQTLDLYLQPSTGSNDAPAALNLAWTAGQQLSDALKQVLKIAYPGYMVTSNISQKLVLPQDQTGFYASLSQLASYANKVSKQIVGGNTYRGVDISIIGTKIIIDDGTVQQGPKMINYYDLIGQPTWLDDSTIQFKCPVRADINPFDWVQFPNTLVTTGPNAPSPFTDPKLTFQGQFQIQNIRHAGNFRQEDAASWCSIFDCVTTPVSAS